MKRILETNRLLLREIEDADVDALRPVLGDAEVMRFGPGAQSEAAIKRWIDEAKMSYRRHGFGPWAVVRRESLEDLGYCGLFHFPDISGGPEVEVGYRLATGFWGKGYATEAVCAVRDYAFGALGLQRIIAIVDPGNLASVKVAEKAGMHYEKDLMRPGYTHPDRVYAINRSSDG